MTTQSISTEDSITDQAQGQRQGQTEPDVQADSHWSASGSSPPSDDAIDRALTHARVSASALAVVLVDCASRGHDSGSCHVARGVMASTAETLAWLTELRAAEISRNDRDADSEVTP